MKSRRRKIGYIYLRLRNIVFRSLLLFIKVYTSKDLADMDVEKILVIKLDRIGDMVMATPIFRAIKEKWPDVQITVLTNPVNNNIVINNPFVNCVLVYDKEGCHRNLMKRLSFFKDIRKNKFDIVIDPYLDYELNTSFITRIVGSRYRLGFEFPEENFFII